MESGRDNANPESEVLEASLQVPAELIRFINSGSMFIIAGHKDPDGDCVGSQLALRSVLLRLGKRAVCCSAGPFKRTELKRFEDQFSAFPDKKENSDARVIVLDCTGMDRTGSLHDLLVEYPVAVIDHHAAATHSPSTSQAPVYTDANSPSCTLLIEKVITALGLELTAEEADLILFGLCTDTGFFRHLTEKNAEVFDAAARLVRRGSSPKNIYRIMNGGKSLDSRILAGRIISRTEPYFGGKLLVCYETMEEFKSFGTENRDSDTVYRMLFSVEGAEAALIIRQELADNCTVSLRSIDKIDVAQISASYGGGGHRNAAGFTMKGSISDVKQIMLESFSKIFN